MSRTVTEIGLHYGREDDDDDDDDDEEGGDDLLSGYLACHMHYYSEYCYNMSSQYHLPPSYNV